MIEKLERYIREEDGIRISCPPDNVHIIAKINELVDAVNTIQKEREAERQTSINHHRISECCRGNTRTAGGYEWQYINKKGGDNE